jgi:hypothetical protein
VNNQCPSLDILEIEYGLLDIQMGEEPILPVAVRCWAFDVPYIHVTRVGMLKFSSKPIDYF